MSRSARSSVSAHVNRPLYHYPMACPVFHLQVRVVHLQVGVFHLQVGVVHLPPRRNPTADPRVATQPDR
eukprot:484314-Pyramimonas_sp.AAC.2